MLTHDNRWSLPRGNTQVPSRWQATTLVATASRCKARAAASGARAAGYLTGALPHREGLSSVIAMVAASWIPRHGGRAKIPAGRPAAQCYGKTSRRGDRRAVALISATAATPEARRPGRAGSDPC